MGQKINLQAIVGHNIFSIKILASSRASSPKAKQNFLTMFLIDTLLQQHGDSHLII